MVVKGATILESMVATTLVGTAIGIGSMIVMNVLSSSKGMATVSATISVHNDVEDEIEEIERQNTSAVNLKQTTHSVEISESKSLTNQTIEWSDE